MSPAAVSAPQIQLFQKEGINTQFRIDTNYFKGKTYLIYGIEQMIREMTDKYELDYDLHRKIIDCECSLQKIHSSCLGDNGMAFGRVQFWKQTFKSNCQGDYYSEKDQLDCYGKMMSGSKESNWTCYTKIK